MIEAESAAGLGTYVKPVDLKTVPDFEHRRGDPKNEELKEVAKIEEPNEVIESDMNPEETVIENGDVEM